MKNNKAQRVKSKKVILALKQVVEYWGVLEAILIVIFFPISLVYILIRIMQEYEGE